MLLDIVLLIVGLLAIVFGADFLVDGASAIARKLKISEFVIGLTIVGFGTSCPELVVSVTGALAGNSDISIGNVIGSNIFNTLLILGITALVMPVAITRSNKRRDIPITLLVTFLLVFCGMSKTLVGLGQQDGLSRVEGIVFLVLFAVYIYSCFKNDEGIDEADSPVKKMSLFVAILLTLAGLAAIFYVGCYTTVQPVKGDTFNNEAIAACVMGGTSMAGGLASILGTVIGSFIIAIMQEGILSMGFNIAFQYSLTALILLGAVIADVMSRRRRN